MNGKPLLGIVALMAACFVSGAQELRLRPDNVDAVVAAMTVDEKVDLVIGCGAGWGNVDAKFPGTAGWTRAIPRLGIPSIYFADGPQGVNMTRFREYDTRDYSCTFFLSGSTLAASWDTEAAEAIGHAVGYELKERGLDVILGPGANLHRNILCGRNQEYFSEDPLLSGKMAAAWIRGAQSNGISTSLKHFAVNNQETNRKENDSRVDARALRELYLKGFEIAVKEGNPGTVMGAYNYVNGVHACENADLLDRLLRQEWGWNGVVMSDWDGVVRQADAVKATCDLIEPGTEADKKALLDALENGSLPMEDLDRNIRHILELVVKSPSYQGYPYHDDIDRESHQRLLRRVAAESCILLRNEGGALPMKPGKVALYGCASYDLVPANMGVNGVNNGVYHVSLVQGLREAGFEVCRPILREYTAYVAAENERIRSAFPPIFAQFYRFDRPAEIIPGQEGGDRLTPEQKAMTVDLGIQMETVNRRWPMEEQAVENDAALITLARTTGEAFDRTASEFGLTTSERNLIETVSSAYHAVGKPVIVLLNVPAALETVSWREKVDAILVVGQPGERAGESIADVLCGAVNPSGHLTDTWPVRYGDAPADSHFPSEAGQDIQTLMTPRKERSGELVSNIDYTEYAEGIYVGYRYFTTTGAEVAYPFGFGLSYTEFVYDAMSVEPTREGFLARVTVRNSGSRPGREVVQLYVSAPKGGLDKPIRELKGFAKTRELAPGESQTLEIPVSTYELASFNAKKSAWQTARGTYTFGAGACSSEIRVFRQAVLPGNAEWKVEKLLLPQH